MWIAICDDNADELGGVAGLVRGYIQQRPLMDLSVREFSSALELVESIQYGGRFSLYLLDVLMPAFNGIAVGEIIRRADERAAIIYMSSSPDYAVDSYAVRASHYLLKPLVGRDLFAALDETFSRMDADAARALPVRTAEGIRALRLHRICYAECRSHCIYYHIADGSGVDTVRSVTMRESFAKTAAGLLGDRRFFRISASFVVNMAYVDAFDGHGVTMTDGAVLAVSRNARAGFKESYVDFLLRSGIGPGQGEATGG